MDTIPRLLTSSATSRPIHLLRGRLMLGSALVGDSQARAMIRHTCSALMSAGRPARGASVRRSVTVRSTGEIAFCFLPPHYALALVYS